jgi:hypothetical protein
MKKNLLKFTIVIGLLVVSCDKVDLSQEKKSKNETSLLQRQSTMFDYIETKHINNDVDCENNILIFPTWDKYWQTIEQLDVMIENDCDAFDATVPNNISDDEYDALADASGFDEDNVLRKFEEDLAFCSLRRKIEASETAWLDQQGDGQWDINDDPDNHFIDDETERALLSENAEVIIGDKEKGYVYYKFIDDEGNWIEVHNNDLNAISQVSQGNIPNNNPNVVVVEPKKDDQSNYICKDRVTNNGYFYGSSNTKVKQIDKLRRETAIADSKIKAKTKGYKKKNGKWRASRTWITTGINAQISSNAGTCFINCGQNIEVLKNKEKRRRRVKVKNSIPQYTGRDPERRWLTIKNNSVYALHKQGQVLIVNSDFYDNQQ